MDCITQCVASVTGDGGSEFGNLAAYSPLSLSQIRERQEYPQAPLSYAIGNKGKGTITMTYSYICQRGLYPDDPDKDNQDAFKITPDFGGKPNSILMGVFDGHGEYGDDCSGFVRDNIDEYLLAAFKQHGDDLEKGFRTAFRQLNSQMHFRTVRRRTRTRTTMRRVCSLPQLPLQPNPPAARPPSPRPTHTHRG